MQIQTERVGDVVVFVPHARLDVSNAQALQAQVAAVLEQGQGAVLLDLSDVAYLSSLGLAACLKSGKLAQAAGARLALCGLAELVHNVFAVSGFLALFAIHPDRDAALAALAALGEGPA